MIESDQSHMPIVQTIIRQIQTNPLPMHVPGHKMGRGFPSVLGSWFENALKMDLTEIEGLDDLHNPSGAILEAQQLAAEAFHADATFFLVNGSTSGNYAMLFAACNAEERVIVARNMHKSVLQACMMRNLRPIFVDLPIDPFTESAGSMTVELVKLAIDRYPDAKAVLLTSPTYQGIFSPIKEIAEVVHQAGMLLLVDEAHGAHLAFHPALRKHSALLQGADMVVQSTHKMLHVKGSRVDYNRIKQYVSYFQSSSPSYLLLASLDAARSQMAVYGEDLLVDSLNQWRALYRESECWRNIQVAPIEDGRDPFKICLKFLHVTTEQAAQWLREHHQVHLELITPSHALAVATYADTRSMVNRLIRALTELDLWIDQVQENTLVLHDSLEKGDSDNREGKVDPQEFSSLTRRVLSQPEVDYRDLESYQMEWVLLDQAVGRIAKYAVIPYPPGIPILCPGERIEQPELNYVKRHIKSKGNVQGLQTGQAEARVAVLKEE
jgi:arginine decarboxylase